MAKAMWRMKMPKYRVEVTEQVTYMFEVEVDTIDPREAAMKVWERTDQSDRELQWMVDGVVTEFVVVQEGEDA